MYKKSLFFICLLWGCYNFNAQATNHKASLQRGAKLFINYCSGCHSLKYMRYNQMAKGLGLLTFDGRVDDDLLKQNLIFTQAPVNAPIEIALSPEDAKKWFGVAPPDLSLVVRERGARWLYLYLSGFYNDKSRPFGVNNLLVHDVMMPNVLASLGKGNSMQDQRDLVTFLSYVSEPELETRYQLGWRVMAFLLIFLLIAFSLKKVYWQKKQPKRLKM